MTVSKSVPEVKQPNNWLNGTSFKKHDTILDIMSDEFRTPSSHLKVVICGDHGGKSKCHMGIL
jgi:hypothetical protein